MKKETKVVVIPNAIILGIGLLLCLIQDGVGEVVLDTGILLFGMFLVNLLLGIGLLLGSIFNAKIVPYALTLMVIAGATALCSFTLCSIQPLKL